ncbi:MAG: ATP-binding protein [Vicinamibacteria bacterium]
MEDRYLRGPIERLAFKNDKMAFLSGPRQAGKTTVGRLLMAERARSRYANWDDVEFRRLWVKSPKDIAAFGDASGDGRQRPLVVLDEIHKARSWKQTLKGVYDTLEEPCDILVTGSARLDIYKRGGESLLGRQIGFRLHPFSLGEAEGSKAVSPDAAVAEIFRAKRGRMTPARRQDSLMQLITYGGFPEPFLKQSARFARIWRRGRVEKLVREDLRDLSRIPDLSRIEMLTALLPERAGNTLSIQSLREDLEVSFDTTKRWVGYLKELFYLFEVKPYTRSIPRTLKKEGKLYLWDWSEVEAPGPRFENVVASHLLKAVHFWTDTGEGTFDLHYLKDKERREVDFLITRDRKPWLAVEAKLGETAWSTSFGAFLPHLGCERFVQVVKQPDVRIEVPLGKALGLVLSAADFLAVLP